MTEPIKAPPSSVPLPPTAPSTTDLAKQMKAQTAALAGHLQQILKDPSLSNQTDFLKEVTANGLELNQTIKAC